MQTATKGWTKTDIIQGNIENRINDIILLYLLIYTHMHIYIIQGPFIQIKASEALVILNVRNEWLNCFLYEILSVK